MRRRLQVFIDMKNGKKNNRKIICFILYPLLFLIFILIALFPTLLSTDFGKNILTNRVKQLHIDKLSLSWFGPQTIQGVQYQTKEMKVSIHSFSTECSLFRIALHKGDIGQTALVSPHILLSLPSEEGKPNLTSEKVSKFKKKEKHSKPSWKNLSGALTITDGKVEVQKKGVEMVSLDEIYVNLIIAQKKSTLSITSHGRTKQNDLIGDFSISGKLGENLYEGLVQINNLPMKGLDQLIGLVNPSLHGILTEAIGETLNVTIDAKSPTTVLQIRSNHINVDLSGVYKEETFSLTQRGSLVWTIKPSVSQKLKLPYYSEGYKEDLLLIAHLDAFILPIRSSKISWDLLKAKGDISLEEGAQSIDKLFISFDTTQDNSKKILGSVSLPFLEVPKFELTLQRGGQFILASRFKPNFLGETIEMNGNGTLEVKNKGLSIFIESLPFQIQHPYSPFSLEKINVHFSYDKKFIIKANATQNNKQAGSIHFQMEGPSFIHLQCKDLSSHIADIFFQTQGQLSEIIGDTIDLNCKLSPSHGERELKCLFISRYLDINGNFLLGKDLRLKNPNHPLKIKWTMTEGSLRAVEKWRHFSSSSFIVKNIANLKIKARSLILPLDFNLSKAIFDSSIKIKKLDFQEARSGENIILSDFDLSFNKKNVEAPLEFTLKGKINYDALNETGHMQAKGSIINLFEPNGKITLSNISTSIHANIKNLPTTLVDQIAKITSNSTFVPSVFLGPRVNAILDTDIQNKMGSIQMNIDATSCKASLSSTISDGIIGLTAPLNASLTITSQMKDALNKKGSIKISSVHNPITLSIQEKGFSIPINDLSLRNIKVQKGTIDFGQITAENTGNTSAIGSIFKMKGNNSISIWFAPLDFKLSKGIMKIDRTEILYNQSLQIALWGDLDFNQQYANMSLGLTAQSLKSALGIGKLGSTYVLEVPLRGPFGDVKVDKAAAAAQIAFLIARTRATSAKAGVFGKVIGVIGELSHNQKNIPPEKPPFPWGKIEKKK